MFITREDAVLCVSSVDALYDRAPEDGRKAWVCVFRMGEEDRSKIVVSGTRCFSMPRLKALAPIIGAELEVYPRCKYIFLAETT